MTPEQFKDARKALFYSQQALADEWNMGAHGNRTIRRWEQGERPLSPIACYALELMYRSAMITRIRETADLAIDRSALARAALELSELEGKQ